MSCTRHLFIDLIIISNVSLVFSLGLSQIKRHFGGSIMGEKTQARLARLAKIKAREAAAKLG